MQMKIFLTNLGKYNEGELVGKWLDLPIYDIEDALLEIGVAENTMYEEYFISDYSSDIDIKISSYESLTKLNKMAELLEDKDADDLYYEILQEYELDDIYDMDCFDEYVEGNTYYEVALMIFNGDFNPHHNYFKFDGYGNLKSISDWEYEKNREDLIIEYIGQYIEDNI